jgi:hypothetical protein
MEKLHAAGKINFRLSRLRFSLLPVIVVFCFLSPLYGADTQRPPININLIIDGSSAFSGAREEITSWVFQRLDQILANGDTVTVWDAKAQSKVIYSGIVNNSTDKENVKKSIREISASGDNADFGGALRDAARQQSSPFSYTILISASNEPLASILSTPNANLLRYSRVEEFSSWRALVVGLNIDTKVRTAAAAFFGS